MRYDDYEVDEMGQVIRGKGSSSPTIRNTGTQGSSQSGQNGGGDDCFVATAVYEDDNAYEVKILRQYRDRALTKSVIGRLFIAVYYKVGPVLALQVQRAPRLQKLLRKNLDRIAALVENR